MKTKLWTLEDAQEAVQAWYNDLKEAYNQKDWEAVAALYNDSSLIFDRARQKSHKNRKNIKKFWREVMGPGRPKMTSVVVKVFAAQPVDTIVRFDDIYRRIIQRVNWTGVMTFELKAEKKAFVTIDFSGDGGHMDVCMFSYPGFEVFG